MPFHSRNAATGQTSLDQRIAKGVCVGLGVGLKVFVATSVDDIATGPLSCPVEGDRSIPAFEL